ncbi:MAG: chromosomal replication initiator protein DnaA [Peptococcaceae bacterium]|nr:chromosomal replication initiator protein DnaA [Peptococcaceae bacterium]
MNDANNMNAMIWNDALKLLENDVNKPTFDLWFRATELAAYYGENIIIKVQNDYAKNFLKNNFTHIIKNHLESMLNHTVKLQFVTPQEKDQAIEQLMQQQGYTEKTINPVEYEMPVTTPEPISTFEQEPRLFTKDTGLNPKYTFDTFVVGGSNRLTHAACMGVADNIANNAETRVYNPLFIHGGSGLGKTHLMHAIGNHILMRRPNTRITYLSSETFTNEIIDAILRNKRKEFRDKYRTVDVLLIDDIQFIADKESTQEEFFHTFNALREAEKQIIISSDRPPNEIPKLEERLRSRFNQGLLTDIQPPDLETRIAILRKKAQAEMLDIPDEVFDYIAENIHSNIRELEGMLTRLSAYSSLSNRKIDLDLTKECLQNLITPNEPVIVTGELIQEKVAEYYQMRVEDFKAKKRTKNIAFPRQIAMYLCREMTDLSLPKIGELFGGRDHTTVMHAYEKITEELRVDQTLQMTISKIKQSLTSR